MVKTNKEYLEELLLDKDLTDIQRDLIRAQLSGSEEFFSRQSLTAIFERLKDDLNGPAVPIHVGSTKSILIDSRVHSDFKEWCKNNGLEMKSTVENFMIGLTRGDIPDETKSRILVLVNEIKKCLT